MNLALFGGKEQSGTGSEMRYWDLAFLCPKLQRPISVGVTIAVPEGYDLLSVSEDTSTTASIEWQNQELAEWAKASAANGRDFAKTMISTLAAAIPIYFAVGKYLGAEQASNSLQSLGVLPPLLSLGGIVAFVTAMRPLHETVNSVEDFLAFRDRRLKTMDRRSLVGLALFLLSLLCAIVFWSILIL
jgi:hypothetical protein